MASFRNDLDLATLSMLESALAAFTGCVLIVSHDRAFLNQVCTAILAFEDDDQLVYQEGDYDYYQEKLAARRRAAVNRTAVAATEEEKRAEPPKKPRERRLTWRENQELDGMEQAILVAEARVASLEAQFSAPDFYARHGDRARTMAVELEESRATVTRLYARWTELAAIRSAELRPAALSDG